MALDHIVIDLFCADHCRFNGRQFWRLTGPHIGPDHAAAFCRLIGFGLDAMFEILMRGYIGHICALAADIKLPAMISAAQAAFLITPEK
jgi:hypothetical protein